MAKIGILLMALAGILAACGGNVSIQRDGAGGAEITITLSESDINTVINTALAQMENPLLRNPSVDLQAGQIIINGEHDRRDGGGRVNGSITLTVQVRDGALDIQATAINIDGLTANDERLAQFNERFAANLTQRLNNAPRIDIVSVNVNAERFEAVFRVRR